jgi:hypothetical protein
MLPIVQAPKRNSKFRNEMWTHAFFAVASWARDPSARFFTRLLADPSFATEEERVKAFVEQGGGCRATYFNHARHLKPPLGVPKIALANSVRPQDEPFDLMDLIRQRHGGLGRG